MRLQALVITLLVAAASAVSIPVIRRDLLPAQNPPSGWKYIGCFVDSVSDRSLKYDYQSSNNQSAAQCISYCSSQGYDIAGTEWSRECFCDWDNNAVKAPESDCGMECSGSSGEACGAGNRLSIYQGPVDLPMTNPGDGSTFTYSGCYLDSIQDHLLPANPFTGQSVTVSSCIAACSKDGYVSNSTTIAYAGVEYGQDCLCGFNTDLPASANGTSAYATGCDMPCRGNGSEFCGGSERLNIYVVESTGASTSTSSSSTTGVGMTTSTSKAGTPAAPLTTLISSSSFAPSSSPVVVSPVSSSSLTSRSSVVPLSNSSISSSVKISTSTSISIPPVTTTSAPASSTLSSSNVSSSTLPSSSSTVKVSMSTRTSNSTTASATKPAAPSSSVSISSSTSSPTATPSTSTSSTKSPVVTPSPMSTSTSSKATTSTSMTSFMKDKDGGNFAITFNITVEQDFKKFSTVIPVTTVTTSSTSALAAASVQARQIIVNGDFETTGIYETWYATENTGVNNKGQLSYSFENATSYTTTGSHAFQVTDTTADSGIRSLCAAQNVYHPSAGRYHVTANIGRVANTGTSNVTSIDTMKWELQFNQAKVTDRDVCNPYLGECDVNARNGQSSYRQEAYTFTVPNAGYHTWSICVIYTGQQSTNPDTFLLDDVTVYGPF